MKTAVHPALKAEFEALADRGFKYEAAIGKVLGLVDELFVEGPTPAQAAMHWKGLAEADVRLAGAEDLRCIDAPDGVVTLIVAWRDDALFMLSAGRGTRVERAAAVKRALERLRDTAWVVIE